MVTGGTKAHSIVATNVVTHDTSPSQSGASNPWSHKWR